MLNTGSKNLKVVQSHAIVFNCKNELLFVSKNGTTWGVPGGTVNKYYQSGKLAANAGQKIH